MIDWIIKVDKSVVFQIQNKQKMYHIVCNKLSKCILGLLADATVNPVNACSGIFAKAKVFPKVLWAVSLVDNLLNILASLSKDVIRTG